MWIAFPAAIAAWMLAGASAGATAVPSLRSVARPGGPTGAAGSVGVVVPPGGPDPPVWAAAGTAAASRCKSL